MDSQVAVWPIINSVVVDNEVDMQAPEGTIFDRCSAGISIFGPAQGSVVLNNRIRGRARAALALMAKPIGVPANSALFRNRLDDFQASVADVFVEEGVMNTQIMGPGIIEDHALEREHHLTQQNRLVDPPLEGHRFAPEIGGEADRKSVV